MDFRIENTTEKDLDEIAAIESQSFDTASAWNRRGFEVALQLPGISFFSAHGALGIVGFCVTSNDSTDDACEVLNITVQRGHRHDGVGTALVAIANRRALESGCETLKAKLSESSVPALCLFRKCGLKVIETLKNDFERPNGDREDCYWMSCGTHEVEELVGTGGPA